MFYFRNDCLIGDDDEEYEEDAADDDEEDDKKAYEADDDVIQSKRILSGNSQGQQLRKGNETKRERERAGEKIALLNI